MAIKRYVPKYKILAKLKQALWLDKRSKINKFKRQKWEGKNKLYFPRKAKNYDQDSSTFVVGNTFDSDRATRLTKTYKYLLQDKQAFQLYYGSRRLKLYQLKQFALSARRLGQRRKVSSGKVFFHLMENRLEVGLYRLGIVNSLMQARKLLTTHRVTVNDNLVKNFGFNLKQGDFIRIEGLKSVEALARYLKFNVPFFYFRRKEQSRLYLMNRKQCAQHNFLLREKPAFFSFLKRSLSQVESLKKKNI